MMPPRQSGAWVIGTSLVAALLLTAMPLPDWATAWRPAWVAMVLVYWCMALPERVGVGIAWLLGLLIDVLKGTLLGQHAAGLCIVALITVKHHRRIRVFPLAQQALFVGFMLTLYLLPTLWVSGMMGLPPQGAISWFPILTSILLWPWLFIILRDIRRKAHVT